MSSEGLNQVCKRCLNCPTMPKTRRARNQSTVFDLPKETESPYCDPGILPDVANERTKLRFYAINKEWQSEMGWKFEKVCLTSGYRFENKSNSTERDIFASLPSEAMTIKRKDRPCLTHDVVGDGNCYFRCISLLVSGTEMNHFSIRKWILANLSRRSIGMDVDKYTKLTKMNRNNTWATEVEIVATAKLLKTDIYVFSLHGRDWQWLLFKGSQHRSSLPRRSVYLHHAGLCHFRIVMKVKVTSPEPITR